MQDPECECGRLKSEHNIFYVTNYLYDISNIIHRNMASNKT